MGPGPGPGAHVRLDPRRLLSGTSTPVAMHFHKKGMEISYIINNIFRIRYIICDILLLLCPKCVQNVFWGPRSIFHVRKQSEIKIQILGGPKSRVPAGPELLSADAGLYVLLGSQTQILDCSLLLAASV